MKIKTILVNVYFFFLPCFFTAHASTPAESISHLGPTITASVQRGSDRLPIYLVDHLIKGDKILVTTTQQEQTDVKWLILLATVTPISNIVDTRQFDLSQNETEASIEIKSDDQIPIIVVAPQVRTMFGLHTSFSESASLISDAIRTDPQRFVDLQKIDQINHAITYLLSVLDSVIQTKKPEQAVEVAKDLAAKFGVRYVNPDCFKDSTVNTKCVAADIVSSENLTIPSDDMWSAAGPNASAVKFPTDIFAGLKLVTETSTYLVNKYGDNYDFAPALGQRTGSSTLIQLFTNARFKSGDVKTAYVYVPSWSEGKQPEINIKNETCSCLTKNELVANIKGKLPLLNYWHDWNLVIYEHGAIKELARYRSINFKPDVGKFFLENNSVAQDFQMNGQSLDAKLTGKYGFTDVTISPFNVVLPENQISAAQIEGIQNLVAGEKSKLSVVGKHGNACVQSVSLVKNNTTIGSTDGTNRSQELIVDLSNFNPGPAKLKIQQYGAANQELAVTIFKRRAHIQSLAHNDLENELKVAGDNLDRIDYIQLNDNAICHFSDVSNLNSSGPESSIQSNPTVRMFTCPAEFASNENFPDKVTVKYKESEPPSLDLPVKKVGARPHMEVDSNGAIITKLSALALQWNLKSDDQLITEDSGISILLHSFGGYKLARGTYILQLKFSDDPQTDEAPISVALMSDLAHNELRTKKPISFISSVLPGIINPVWYRVQHQPSGAVGDWQPLNRSVVYLPKLTSLSCDSGNTYVHGTQLDLVDWLSGDSTQSTANQSTPNDTATKSNIGQCDDDQCLVVKEVVHGNKLKVKLHWIDDRIFDVTFSGAPSCTSTK